MDQLCGGVNQDYSEYKDRADASSDCVYLIVTLNIEARQGLAKDVEAL